MRSELARSRQISLVSDRHTAAEMDAIAALTTNVQQESQQE